MKIIAMIPARIGSQRLSQKNLALVGGKPLVQRAIEAAKAANVFDEIIVSSDSEEIKQLAKSLDVKTFERSDELASSSAKSDEIVNEFLQTNKCDYIIWMNTTSPLQTGEEVARVVKQAIQDDCDSFFTSYLESVHANYKNEPLNYSTDGLFAKTQDLEPVERFVYSVMGWKVSTFLDEYQKNSEAFFCGTTKTYPVSKASALIVKNLEDIALVDAIASANISLDNYSPTYYSVTEDKA